ncbi:scm-like with four MBT domains protein 1 [Maniola hyperantus]|uniref:scm-like with four MBT domains protein 1 n=1 Tax=Aphantopus hyperantus TaxID=2795564 RepID=UPI001569C024|nr:scm-like with four MBT domains protein 1 [Maniola hyperantus]
MEFDWNNYLEDTKSVAVPEELFSHVETSLNNGIKQGMLLEVCHKTNPDMYWIAEITMVCAHLLRIKFIGAETDFWCDISKTKVHPLGWCGKYDELIEPPDDINSRCGNSIIDLMKQALLVGQSVSIEALNHKGLSPIDRIKGGMKVEIQNIIDPYRYWIATVCENAGGRLLLRYDGADDDLAQFWMFFCNPRLSSFGFVTNKGSPWQFKYPGKVNKFSCKNKLSAQLRQSAEEAISEPTPADLFQPNQILEAHSFATGMKMEALSPNDFSTVHPATVLKIFNNLHFLVVLDDHVDDYEDSKMAWLCDNMHPYIYPLGWAQRNKVEFKPPKIWKEDTFDWEEYLSMTASVPAPDYCFGNKEFLKGIEVNMKLEAVNPLNHEEIHVASIETITEHMLYVELLPIGEKYWYSQDSDLLFPVGWCDSNNYELHIPDTNKEPVKPIEDPKPVKDDPKSTEEWCDRIYFNYRCYAGPSISRNKLSQLPKHVGPGPLLLVLKEVMNKIISASYKPAKLLKDWETEGPPEEGMQLEMLRAKLKTSTYHAYVPIATTSEQVSSFCRDVCVKLQACPSLFGPVEYPEQCPNNCQQVEKSTFHNGTERRGRPKGSVNGKRKKKKGAPEKREKEQPPPEVENNRDGESVESEHSAGSTPPSESGTRPNSPDSVTDYKRNTRRKREAKSDFPKLEMKTRGAKLPNFALQMKEAHWNKKDVETIYSNSCTSKKQQDSDTENETNESSCNSRDAKNISDVSDSEEPELKKLKFHTDDPLPSDNKMFEKDTAMKGKVKLGRNPLDWTVEDVYNYLNSTEDCKLIADKMKQEEIDGEAFIMLDLPTITDFLHMKKEYAMQLCKHITMIRWYCIDNFEENVET